MDTILKKSVHSFAQQYIERIDSFSLVNAIELAYADMSRRAKGHCPQIKEKCIAFLCKEFKALLFDGDHNCISKQDVFDKWHHTTCKEFISEFDSVAEESNTSIRCTYGRAQKVVNMTFKYLYCLKEFDENKKELFKFCHMPLDSFVLDWIWVNNKKLNTAYGKIPNVLPTRLTKGYFDSWSNLEYDSENKYVISEVKKYSYMFYQELIRKYCEEKNITPLQLDFIVWQQFQWEQAANEFYKQTSKLIGQNEDISSKNATDKFKKIFNIIDSNKNLALYEW